MAHNIRPQHRPHEQLRTEAPAQKKHTDKYVSAFVSSENYVDMSFNSPLLQESADHYRVGVDELSASLSHLSILENEGEDNVLFRIRRLGYWGDDKHPNVNNGQEPDVFDADVLQGIIEDEIPDVGNVVTHFGLANAAQARSLEFRIDRQYTTIAQIMERAQEICRALRTIVPDMQNAEVYDSADPDTYARWNLQYHPERDFERAGDFPYFTIDLTAGGMLRFKGSAHFWSNFVIEIPEPKYQYLLLGPSGRQFIALHPRTGTLYDPYADENLHVTAPDGEFVIDHPTLNYRSLTGEMVIPKSLDRRVAVEVGCSLPLKNSPMFDHGQESPDFVIGRFFLNHKQVGLANTDIGTMSLDVPDLGPRQLCGPKDRVCYHHLGPQQKIQNLRLRLWARVRTYNADTKKWGMKTIQMPVVESDYWHIKLHFKPKVGRY